MAYSKSVNKAVQKYSKKAYDTFVVRVKKGKKEAIQKHAESKGLSLNSYINELISKDMEYPKE
ncbi:MAG: hypothetical protein JG769_329 [Oscillospiraceae bacterium]|jgi:predicted HicB family RNase H-like nuclease|nr:hypothetical protein [Oscillospiraceae bacterium]